MSGTNTTADDRLAEIQQRAEKATPGPWTYHDGDSVSAPDGTEVVAGPWTNDNSPCVEIGPDDADFITYARDDIPWLLAELVSLRGQLEAATEQLAEADEYIDGAIGRVAEWLWANRVRGRNYADHEWANAHPNDAARLRRQAAEILAAAAGRDAR